MTFVIQFTYTMRHLLLILPLLFIAHITNAQCNITADNKVKKIEAVCFEPEYQNLQAYDSLRKEMYVAFDMLESCVAQNPSYDSRAKLKKIYLYFTIGELAGQVGKYSDMLKFIEAMERLLPSPSAISASSAASFTISGTNYTSDVTSSYISNTYYQIIERRVNYHYFGDRNNQKVIDTYEKLNNAPSSFEPAELEALLYADALYKSGKTADRYFPAMAKAASLFGPEWAKKEEHDSSMINNRSLLVSWFRREMNYNKSNFTSSDPDGKWRLMAARGLWGSDEKDMAKQYALSASESGASNLSDGYWYLDVVANGEAKHEIAALNIIERSASSISDSDLDRILKLAQKHNMTSLERTLKTRLRRIANLQSRSKISLYPAVELIGLPCKHIPVSLNLRTGRVLQEFRFDYVWGAVSRYRFGRIFDRQEKGNKYRFTGWDAGYTINVILGKDFRQGNKKRGRSAFYAPAIGLDFRYVNWNLDPMTTNVLDANGSVTESNVRIDATTNRYELCYRVSLITMTRYATIDYYFGLGVGYRTLKTAQGRDVETEFFQDARLDGDRWNKIYMPIRFGLKIGLNLL